jgi:hypothetical protein
MEPLADSSTAEKLRACACVSHAIESYRFYSKTVCNRGAACDFNYLTLLKRLYQTLNMQYAYQWQHRVNKCTQANTWTIAYCRTEMQRTG